MDGRRDLVEPEGVNAGSAQHEPADPAAMDVHTGGRPDEAPEPDEPQRPDPELAGAPAQSEQALDEQFGVEADG